MTKSILIIAGETSGDTHGAALVRALKELHPEIKIAGIGGNRMMNSGMELLYHVRDMSFMGFVEVVKHLPFIFKVRDTLETWVEENSPDAVILIDYPGFNLRFARIMKNRELPVYYYISPQVWAWGKGRLKKMKHLVDKMFVIFPFEEDLYRKHEVRVEFVGHPLVEEVDDVTPRQEFYEERGFDPDVKTIGLFPGSRMQEIERHLDTMIAAVKRIRKETQEPLQCWLAVAPDLEKSAFGEWTEDLNVQLVQNATYELMKHSDIAITSSGSATLEIAYFGTPMIIIYKMSNLTWWLGNLLVDMPYIGLANIVAEKKVVPELLQNEANPGKIAETALKYLEDETYYSSVKNSLSMIRNKLGDPGAGRRVAQSIADEIYKSQSETTD